MRRTWILAIALAVCVTHCPAQYFPKSSLDLRGDDFKVRWYSSQLHALKEPSLFRLSRNPTSESYRFLWLRSFNHPIAIRAVIKGDGTGVLITKVANGSGGFRPGVLIENTSRVLNREETQAFLLRVNRVDFWEAPNPVDDQRGTDGSQWVMEGVKRGQYHIVDRWMPRDGVAHELGLMLAVELAKLNLPKNEIY